MHEIKVQKQSANSRSPKLKRLRPEKENIKGRQGQKQDGSGTKTKRNQRVWISKSLKNSTAHLDYYTSCNEKREPESNDVWHNTLTARVASLSRFAGRTRVAGDSLGRRAI